MHPAGGQSLPHPDNDNTDPGLALLPGCQIFRCMPPLDFIGIFFKRAMSGTAGKIEQGMLIKLTPQQFIQPGLLTEIIDLEIAMMLFKQRLNALADRENADI